MSQNKKKTLYLVDGSYYIYRAYYALRNLSNSKGFPTNGLYGFVGMLKKLFDDFSPEYLIVTFDPRGGSFRNELYPAYKANRDAPPEDLTPQMPLFRDIVRAYNIPCVELPGYEADDVLGTLGSKAQREDFDVVIVTGDKDLYQLVTDRLSLYDTMRDRRIGVDEVKGKFNVAPPQVPDVLGLMGDTSDNIPGVRGVGEKTAGKLIAKYGSIEAVLESLDDFKGKKLQERLDEGRENAFLSRNLATIRLDLEVDFDAQAALRKEPDLPVLAGLFQEWEFTSHLEELRKRYGALPGVDDVEAEVSEQRPKRYDLVTSPWALDEVVASIRRVGEVAVDVHSTRSGPMTAEMIGVGLSWAADQGVYVPVGHDPLRHPEQLTVSYALEVLRPVFEDADIVKTGLHGKHDWVLLRQHGVELKGLRFDLTLASYLLDASRKSHDLRSLAWDVLKQKTDSFAELAGTGAPRKSLADIGFDDAAHLAAEEADLTGLLSRELGNKLEESGLRSLHDDLELPLSLVLAGMERHGVLIDSARLRGLSQEFQRRMAELEGDIHESAGYEFNVNSPKQLAKVLFEDLGLPVVKRTKTGPSTDQSVLDQLAPSHPVPDMIVKFRALSKLKSTYTDSLPTLVHPETGRIHTEFNQTVAATGRLSSNNPNLQNIPVRTDEGRRIREAFIAPPGWSLLSADYSQVELRLLAHMSGDDVLVDGFNKGQDIHARTASELFEVATDDISKAQRSIAKTINFGVLYGMGAVRLARELGISRKEAKAFIARYFERMGEVKTFLDELVVKAKASGFAETILGRRRPLPELRSRNRGVQALGERLAVNTPLQGTAADIIKVAMVNIQRCLDESDMKANMLLQVHDELVFEVADEHLERVRQMVVDEMQGAVALQVPLLVDVSHGRNWAAL